MNIYRQAAENLAGEAVSIEQDGTYWTGTDAQRVYLDVDEIEAEVRAIQKAEADKAKADQVAREAAIAHAKSLGFTDEMIAIMYPNIGGQ